MLVVALVWLFTACGGATITPATDVIPWSPVMAGPIPSPSPTPANAPALRACMASDISVRLGRTTAGGGTTFRSIVFTNVSSTQCGLDGLPTVVPLDGTGAAVTIPESELDPNSPSGAIALGVGISQGVANSPASAGQGVLVIGLATDMCIGRPIAALTVTTVAGTSVQVPFSVPASTDSMCVPAQLFVSRFESPTQSPQSVPQPDFLVAYRLPPSAIAGQTLQYQIDLTNVSGRSIAFAQCPGYTEFLKIAQVTARYVLNCSPVGSMQVGATLTFAMEFPIPTGGAFKALAEAPPDRLNWVIDPPYVSMNATGPGEVVVGAS